MQLANHTFCSSNGSRKQNNDFLKFISLGKLSCSLPLFQGCWWILPKQVIIAEFVYFQWVACVSKVLFMGKMSCRENAIRPQATFLLAEPMYSTKILQSCWSGEPVLKYTVRNFKVMMMMMSLVAGLTDPVLLRLDVESKLSDQLKVRSH